MSGRDQRCDYNVKWPFLCVHNIIYYYCYCYCIITITCQAVRGLRLACFVFSVSTDGSLSLSLFSFGCSPEMVVNGLDRWVCAAAVEGVRVLWNKTHLLNSPSVSRPHPLICFHWGGRGSPGPRGKHTGFIQDDEILNVCLLLPINTREEPFLVILHVERKCRFATQTVQEYKTTSRQWE